MYASVNWVSIGSDNGLIVAYSAPSHYLNQCWNIINWTFRDKFQWNLNRNLFICIQGNASENIVCEKAAILSRGDESRGAGKSARAQGIGTGTVKNGAVIRIRQFCNGANTGRLASTLKSVTYFCKNCQFWKKKKPWGYRLKSSVNECIIMYSALVHKQHVEYLSVEFMRTCPDEQPMSRRQFIHGKEPYCFAWIHWCSVVCWYIRRRYIMRHMSEVAAE